MRARVLGLLVAVVLFLLPLKSFMPASLRLADLLNLEGPADLLPVKGAQSLFQLLDANGDGVLDEDEMPPALRAGLERWDANQNGVIDAGEFRAWFADHVRRRQGNCGIARIEWPGSLPAPRVCGGSAPAMSPMPSRARDWNDREADRETRARAALDALAITPLPLDDGTNPAWLVYNEENEDKLARGAVNVLFLGDSIGKRLDSAAAASLWKKWFEPLAAIDASIPGITTSEVLWQIESGQVAIACPKVVVLSIGADNLAVGQSPPAVAAGIARIVDRLQEQLPSTRILLVGLLPRGETADDPSRLLIAQVNSLLAHLDDGERVCFLDIGSRFLARDGSISPLVMADFANPTLLGWQIYTESVWQPLLGLLLAE